MGARIFRGCLRLDDICRETEQRSAKVFGLLDAIERRIGPLDEVRELTRALDTRLASARQIAEEFAGRVSESQAAFVDITARMSEVDAKRESIDLALSAATHVALTLDQRIAAFTGPEHVLRQAETAYEELELRSRETVADLSARVAGLSAERQAIESALAQAAQQARVLAERLSLLTGPDQALSGAEQRLEEIERRAGHAFADLGARAADLDARCGAIDAVLTAAARGADAVDRRAATLAAPDQPLGQAELRPRRLRDSRERAGRRTSGHRVGPWQGEAADTGAGGSPRLVHCSRRSVATGRGADRRGRTAYRPRSHGHGDASHRDRWRAPRH
jgi:chromosome segregation ATPase